MIIKQRSLLLCCLGASLIFLLSLLVEGQTPIAHAATRTTHVQTQNLVQYVNPLIGTATSNAVNPVPGGGGGSVFPGAAVPFGMMQWSPDTPNGSPSGYNYADSQITGFSLTHFSGAGCANNGNIPITPTVGSGNTNTSISFSHNNEVAQAGYYSLTLGNSVKTELTATLHTGFGQFTFPSTSSANIDIDASRASTSTSNASVQVSGTNEVSGQQTSHIFCGSSQQYTIYFDAQFDRSFTVSKSWTGGVLVTFNAASNAVVHMKIGISYVSISNAKGNLTAENPNWDFNSAKSSASDAWNARLNHIQVSGGTTQELSKFYTALYHALLHPNVFSDTNGQYTGFDGKVYTASGYTQYANYSGWDIYRSEVPLLAMLFPSETNDMIKSLIADAQQCGAFPKWAQNNVDSGVMVGDPDSISVVNAYAFGATNFDTATALSFMIKSATQAGTSCGGDTIRSGLTPYLSNGYIPYDNSPEWGPASTTLEYTSADFAIAQFANTLGDKTTYRNLIGRSTYWQNEFNASTGYIEPRNQDGSWESNFDPTSINGYVEGNAAQYSWMIPYDLGDIFNKMGGNSAVVPRLNNFFSKLNAGLNDPNFYMGNEPNFATPWVYDWAQDPSGTQNVVRNILDQVFTPDPGGLPGNDDLGAMSSWYVWGALGIYPEIPGIAGFSLASPMFSTSTITLGNGNIVTMNASGAPATFVQSMTLNGSSYNSPWLPMSAISGGATIGYTLGNSASTWGSAPNNAPPSYGPGTFTGINAALNGRGISSDANTTAANLDGGGFSYSREALAGQGLSAGSTVTVGGLTYAWPSTNAGDLDNTIAVGQTIVFSSPPKAGQIGFLGSSTNGPATGNGTITYTDNSTLNFSLGLSDWTLNGNTTSPSYGNTTAVTTSYRNGASGKNNVNTYVFAATIGINANKTVKSVTLPAMLNKGGLLHIFAISLGGSSSNGGTFSTGFESGQPQPTWTNTVDNAGYPAGGSSNIGGICCSLSGPEAGTRSETAHGGSVALLYSGLDNSTSSSYAYMQVFNLSGQNVTVGSNTTLSYWIYPQSSATNNLVSGSNSSCVAIDLIFSDNTNLRDSGAVDQNGNRAHPAFQCGHLTMDTWNHVTVNLGSVANGKTVIRIDLGYDQPANTGGYRGYLDDISIG